MKEHPGIVIIWNIKGRINKIKRFVLLFIITFVLILYSACDINNPNKNMDSWIGEYGFNEFAPPNQNMFYSISIDKNKNDYYADISIFGFQTNIRIQAKIVGDENFINLLFNKYLPDNVYEPYEKGDVLLSFKKSDEEIYTYWGEIRPMIKKNYKSGEIYFLKK